MQGFWINALTKSLMHTCMFELARHIHSEAGGIAEACTGCRATDAKFKQTHQHHQKHWCQRTTEADVSVSFKARKKRE